MITQTFPLIIIINQNRKNEVNRHLYLEMARRKPNLALWRPRSRQALVTLSLFNNQVLPKKYGKRAHRVQSKNNCRVTTWVWLFNRRIPPGNRGSITLEENAGVCYCWTTKDLISCTIITDPEYPEKAAFLCINNLLMDFRNFFEADPSIYMSPTQD